MFPQGRSIQITYIYIFELSRHNCRICDIFIVEIIQLFKQGAGMNFAEWYQL